MLHIDLERYRRVNKGLGHEAGDALLIQLAQRLAHAVADGGAPSADAERSPHSALARWSGAEFIVLTGDLSSPLDAGRLAQRLLASIRQPFHSDDDEMILDARIGIAIHPADGATASSLINASIAATHHPKNLSW